MALDCRDSNIGGYIDSVPSAPAKTVSKNKSNSSKEYIDPKKMPNPEAGYVPPKKNPNPQKVRNPNGPGSGWPDNEGGVWVPDNRQDGGAGWVQQFPDGSHRHRYPSGHIRGSLAYVAGAMIITAGAITVVVIAADDCTGLGVADDFVIAPALALINKGVELIC